MEEPITISLEKSRNYDWDKVYYYIIEIRSQMQGYFHVLGGGETIKECKEMCLARIATDTRVPYRIADTVSQMIMDASLNTVFYSSTKSGAAHKYGLFIGEAKVYIYGKRLGFDRIKVGYDPYVERTFVRYLGVRK